MSKLMLSAAVALSSTMLVVGCNSGPKQSFSRDVQPILQKNCAECHVGQGEGVQKSNFHVDSYETIMQGTKFGPVVVAGDADSSSLYRLIAGKVDKSIQMPHGKQPLSAEDIAVIKRWINQGAKND